MPANLNYEIRAVTVVTMRRYIGILETLSVGDKS